MPKRPPSKNRYKDTRPESVTHKMDRDSRAELKEASDLSRRIQGPGGTLALLAKHGFNLKKLRAAVEERAERIKKLEAAEMLESDDPARYKAQSAWSEEKQAELAAAEAAAAAREAELAQILREGKSNWGDGFIGKQRAKCVLRRRNRGKKEKPAAEAPTIGKRIGDWLARITS